MIPPSRILAPALLAALATTIAPASAPGQGALRGRVIDSEMGTPLAGATVQVGKAGQNIVLQDGDTIFVP